MIRDFCGCQRPAQAFYNIIISHIIPEDEPVLTAMMAAGGPSPTGMEIPTIRQWAAAYRLPASLGPSPRDTGPQGQDTWKWTGCISFPFCLRQGARAGLSVSSGRTGRPIRPIPSDQDRPRHAGAAISPGRAYSGLGFFSEGKQGTLEVYWIGAWHLPHTEGRGRGSVLDFDKACQINCLR